MSKRPELLITNGELAGKRYVVKDGGLRLGRSSSNDIQIPDEGLSRNHCLFETTSNNGIRLTDLASANGTYLNGKALGSDPANLRPGDLVEVGETVIKVVVDEPVIAPMKIDLGLNPPAPAPAEKKRSVVANLLWFVTVIIGLGAIGVVFVAPKLERTEPTVAPVSDVQEVKEVYYEKVEADSNGIFRYELCLTPEKVLTVKVDDVPKEDRHITKSEPLNDKAYAEINEILNWNIIHEIDHEYAGVEQDPPTLNKWELKVVYTSKVRRIRITNTQRPDAFRAVSDKLEAFSKNQLGIWALQYSRDKLITLAEEAIALGKSKWDERRVEHGNLFSAVAAYKEAVFYLDTLNPKPDCINDARQGLEMAQNELNQVYSDQRFQADRAINIGQWDVAQKELKILLEMIPDRNDDRNREAATKLVDVEKRIKGGL